MTRTVFAHSDLASILTETAKRIWHVSSRFETETINVALTGGRTTGALFQQMVHHSSEIEPERLQKFRFFLADERRVPLDHADSNYRVIRESLYVPLLERGLIEEGQIFPPPVHEVDPSAIAKSYGEALQSVGGRIDIAILSSGEDGHVASLFPHHRGLHSSDDFITLDDSPKPPPERLSIGPKHLVRAQVAVLLFVGEGKREALTNFADPSASIDACPAKLVSDVEELVIATDLVGVVS